MSKFELNKEEEQYFVDGLRAAKKIVKGANEHSLSPICMSVLEAEVFKKIASNVFWTRESVKPLEPTIKTTKSLDPKEIAYQKTDKLLEQGRREREERRQAGIKIGAIPTRPKAEPPRSYDMEEYEDFDEMDRIRKEFEAKEEEITPRTFKAEDLLGKDLTIIGADVRPSSFGNDGSREYVSIEVENGHEIGVFNTGSKALLGKMKHAINNELFPLKAIIEKRKSQSNGRNYYTFKTMAVSQ